jgi:hypothetical protein
LLDNLGLQLAKKFFARLVRFFLNLLKFFLPAVVREIRER